MGSTQRESTAAAGSKVCVMCGKVLVKGPHAGKRRFCSNRCRKRQYDRECVDCGARISGTDPGSTSMTRCRSCAAFHREKQWSPALIVAAIRWWNDEYGEPPASGDWSATTARFLHDPVRAARAASLVRDGMVPHRSTVIGYFGSWNAAIRAAGFEPRENRGFYSDRMRRARAS